MVKQEYKVTIETDSKYLKVKEDLSKDILEELYSIAESLLAKIDVEKS